MTLLFTGRLWERRGARPGTSDEHFFKNRVFITLALKQLTKRQITKLGFRGNWADNGFLCLVGFLLFRFDR